MHGRDLPQFKNLAIGATTKVDGVTVKCVEGKSPYCENCHFNTRELDIFYGRHPNQVCPIDYEMKSIGSKLFCADDNRADGKHVKYVRVAK